MSKLDRYRNGEGKIWLNVASSVCILEGFVNLDNHIFLRILNVYPLLRPLFPRKYREFVETYRENRKRGLLVKHDCRKRLFFPKDSVDHILCSHFLEHVYPDETVRILADFHRALKKGGTLHVIVPDIERQAKQYLAECETPDAADRFVRTTLLTRENRGSLKYRLLEFSGGFGLQHRWMYDHASMKARVQGAGFNVLDKNETPSRDFRAGDDSVHVVAQKP